MSHFYTPDNDMEYVTLRLITESKFRKSKFEALYYCSTTKCFGSFSFNIFIGKQGKQKENA